MPLWGSAVHHDSSYSCLAQVCNACVTRALEATSGSAPSSTLCTWFGATRHHRSSCNEEHKGNSQQKQQQRKLGNCSPLPPQAQVTCYGCLVAILGDRAPVPRPVCGTHPPRKRPRLPGVVTDWETATAEAPARPCSCHYPPRCAVHHLWCHGAAATDDQAW